MNSLINKNKSLLLNTIKGNLKIIDALLINGADINTKNKNGDTTLIWVTRKSDLKITKTLLANNANVHHENQYGNTALMYTATNVYLPIANTLLAYGANVNHKNKEGNNPSILVAQNGHIKILNILNTFLKTKVLITKFYQEFEKQITKNNSQQLIIALLSAFQEQIEKNNTNQTLTLDIMEFLKKEFINNLYFEEENYSLLHIAVLYNWEKLVIHLVNKWSINVDYEDISGNSPWNYTCLLLQKQNPFIFKKYNFQLTAKDKKFLTENIDLCKNQFITEKEKVNINAAKNRLAIINYYKDNNNIIYYKEEINAIDLEQKLQICLTNENKPTI